MVRRTRGGGADSSGRDRAVSSDLKIFCVVLALVGVTRVSLGADLLLNGSRSAVEFGLASVGIGLAYFAVAYGLWNRRSWAWTMGMAALLLHVVLEATTLRYSRLVIPVALLAYFLRKHDGYRAQSPLRYG